MREGNTETSSFTSSKTSMFSTVYYLPCRTAMRDRDLLPQAFGDYRTVWLSIRALEWASDSSSANLSLYDMRQVTYPVHQSTSLSLI